MFKEPVIAPEPPTVMLVVLELKIEPAAADEIAPFIVKLFPLISMVPAVNVKPPFACKSDPKVTDPEELLLIVNLLIVAVGTENANVPKDPDPPIIIFALFAATSFPAPDIVPFKVNVLLFVKDKFEAKLKTPLTV